MHCNDSNIANHKIKQSTNVHYCNVEEPPKSCFSALSHNRRFQRSWTLGYYIADLAGLSRYQISWLHVWDKCWRITCPGLFHGIRSADSNMLALGYKPIVLPLDRSVAPITIQIKFRKLAEVFSWFTMVRPNKLRCHLELGKYMFPPYLAIDHFLVLLWEVPCFFLSLTPANLSQDTLYTEVQLCRA